MHPVDIIRQLRSRGHVPEYDEYGPAFRALAVPDPELAKDLIKRFQRFYSLPETGIMTPETEAQLMAPRCGQPDMLAVTQASGWGITDLCYWQDIQYPGVDPDELAYDYDLAVQRVTEVCGINATRAASASVAHILAVSGRIDGPWNVLALSELPPPGNITLTLNQKFDPAEIALTRAQRQAMMAHEFCHCLGLGHAPPGSGALMEPVLHTVATPQAWDRRELLARYPLTAPTDPDPEPAYGTPVTSTSLVVTTVQAGAKFTIGLDGPGKYVITVVPLP
jgi:hypothetical protein